MADSLPPLTWETSANTAPEQSDSLPAVVSSCLQNAKYLHLATCTNLHPHISLMNYTYLESHPFDVSDAPTPSTLPRGPIIIMTTNPSSRKTMNLMANPNVSLLVHDWVSVRPPPPRPASPTASNADRSNGMEGPSSLAALLMGMNSSEMGKISATINGTASVLSRGSEVEAWCQEQHLRFNGFSDLSRTNTGPGPTSALSNGDASTDSGLAQLSGSPNTKFSAPDKMLQEAVRHQEDDDVRVVVVRIKDGRIADWKGGVRDFVLTGSDTAR